MHYNSFGAFLDKVKIFDFWTFLYFLTFLYFWAFFERIICDFFLSGPLSGQCRNANLYLATSGQNLRP